MSGIEVGGAIPIVLALIACSVVTVLVWQRRHATPAVRRYAWSMLGQCLWCAGYLGELLARSLRGKIVWDSLQVAPVYICSIELLAFALVFSGRGAVLRTRAWKLMWVVPAVHVVSSLTAPWNGFSYRGAHLAQVEGFQVLSYQFNLLDAIGYVLGLSLLPLSFGIVVSQWRGQESAFRLQFVALLCGLVLPVISGVSFFSGITLFGQRDTMPYAFAISSLLIGWALLRGGLFDLVPIANEMTIASSPDAVLVTDRAGHIVQANRAFERLAGADRKALLGRTVTEVAPWLPPVPENGPRWSEHAPVQEVAVDPDRVFELRRVHATDGTGQILGDVTSLQDVTHRHRIERALSAARDDLELRVQERTAELVAANEALRQEIVNRELAERSARALSAQLAQAQKMDSLGRLAGGIAHDFNNLLTAILGNVELARLTCAPQGELELCLSEIAHAGESAKALVQQLLAFGRKHHSERVVLDLRDSVQSAVKMLGRLLDANVTVQLSLPEERLCAKIDPIQIEQIVVNLVVNARDALHNGGTIAVRLDAVNVDTGGRHVRLRVTDDGVGMSEDVLARVFEPFFTTKPVGQGTGLGLSLVFAAVQQHEGTIEVTSKPGHGTTFTILVPEVIPRHDSAEPTRPPELTGGGENIVLVEDQPEIRRFAARALGRLGYRVHPFDCAENALSDRALVAAADLLISDVVLPHMSGPELARQLLSVRPQLRVLLVSGYHEESLRRRSADALEFKVLQKPFAIDQLAATVRELLDARFAPAN